MSEKTHSDDSFMSRFEQQGLRRFSARQAVLAVSFVALVLVLFSGNSVREAGEEMDPGIGRDLVLGFGKPAGWVADRLPLQEASADLTGWLSPDSDLSGQAGFDAAAAGGGANAIPPITADSYEPTELEAEPAEEQPLRTLLVTGDSLSTPLDQELAQRLSSEGVRVIRSPQLGTGISNDFIVDWAQLSGKMAEDDQPDAVVVFIGANEGYPLPGPKGRDVNCCELPWAVSFAQRVRQVMENFRQGGDAQVYWLTVPTPRDPARQEVSEVVNEAILVAAQPWPGEVRLIDTVPVFTPGERYRDAMDVDGEETIVRESDGIHLNDVGSSIAADAVLEAIDADFSY